VPADNPPVTRPTVARSDRAVLLFAAMFPVTIVLYHIIPN